jgi:hypothetical protein
MRLARKPHQLGAMSVPKDRNSVRGGRRFGPLSFLRPIDQAPAVPSCQFAQDDLPVICTVPALLQGNAVRLCSFIPLRKTVSTLMAMRHGKVQSGERRCAARAQREVEQVGWPPVAGWGLMPFVCWFTQPIIAACYGTVRMPTRSCPDFCVASRSPPLNLGRLAAAHFVSFSPAAEGCSFYQLGLFAAACRRPCFRQVARLRPGDI